MSRAQRSIQGPAHRAARWWLFRDQELEIAVDVGKDRCDRVADAAHDGYRRKSNKGCNQPILDQILSGLFLVKPQQKVFHTMCSLGTGLDGGHPSLALA